MADFDRFKNCLRIEEKLDVEALEFAVFEPLQAFNNWWGGQSEATHRFATFLVGFGGGALKSWVMRVAGIASEKTAALLLTFLATLTLGLLMAAVARCLALQA